MSTSRYDWHKSILETPSIIFAMLFGLSFNSWWLGVFLGIVSMVLLTVPYRLYFSVAEGQPRRRHIGTNMLFILLQIIFWGIAFALLYAFKHSPAI